MSTVVDKNYLTSCPSCDKAICEGDKVWHKGNVLYCGIKCLTDSFILIEEELLSLDVKKEVVTMEDIQQITNMFNEHYKELTRTEKRAFIQKHIKGIEYNRELVKGFKKKYTVTVTHVDFM